MNFFSWRRSIAITKKEIFHILRDPFTLALAIGMPLFMVFVYGFAIDFNIKNIPISVSDFDKTVYSREIIQTFSSSQYFIVHHVNNPDEVLDNIESEKTRAGLIIPPNFSRDLGNGRNGIVQILLDGSDNSTIGPISGYMSGMQNKAIKEWTNFDMQLPYEIKTRFLFNPELNSQWFIIPGLIAVVMAILSILLTTLTVAREWENGSMEILLTTPVKPIEIIVGKVIPYAFLGLVTLLMIFIINFFVFKVPFVGNPFIFILGYILFLISFLAQGLLISIITKNQQIALNFAILLGFLPSQLLSGFIFPIASMPIFFQYLTLVFPARWFVQISRDTFLKGTRFVDLWPAFTMLFLICMSLVWISILRFKRTLEK